MSLRHSILDNFDCQTAGIDKLNITTREFIVPDANRLNIDFYGRKVGQAEPQQQPLFVTPDGEYIEGRKAHFNGNGYGLNISPYGLSVVMSPAKVLTPNKPFLLPTDAQQIDDAVRTIEGRIKADTGILLSYDNANICRLDLARQIRMPRPIADYSPAFNTLRLKGSQNKNRTFGDQTFTYNSTSSPHQFSFYDKAVEFISSLPQKDLPDELKKLSNGSEYLRAELRLLQTDYVKKATNTDANYQRVLSAGFTGLNGIYDNYLHSKIFTGHHQTTMHFDMEQIRERFEHELQKQTNRTNRQTANIAGYVIQGLGASQIVDNIGIDAFMSVAENYLSRASRYRIRSRILLMATEYQPKNKISVTQLINELKHAFAA